MVPTYRATERPVEKGEDYMSYTCKMEGMKIATKTTDTFYSMPPMS